MVFARFGIYGSLEVLFEAARQKDLEQAARREKDPPLQSSTDVNSFDAVLRFKQCISVYIWR